MDPASDTNYFIMKFRDLSGMTEAETNLLRTLVSRRRRYEAHQTIVHEGDPTVEIFVVQHGWTCVHKMLPTGARQIISFPLPGDVVGVSDIMAGRAAGSLEALTEVVVSPIPAAMVKTLLLSPGPVGSALSRCVDQANAIVVEHLVSAGRRSALARTAHLLLEFSARLKQIGIESDKSFELPLSQTCLGDALGLTPIHVNRVLRQLREMGLLAMKSGVVSIYDWDALVNIASFSPDYLAVSRKLAEQPRHHTPVGLL